MPDDSTREGKLELLSAAKLEMLDVVRIEPDADGNWLNNEPNDFKTLLRLADKEVKLGRNDQAVFHLFSLGIATNRDEWAYNSSADNLGRKIRHFCAVYSSEEARWRDLPKKVPINDFVSREIKWTSELEAYLVRGSKLKFTAKRIREASYRPFTRLFSYFDHIITHRPYQNENFYGIAEAHENIAIVFTDPSSQKPFLVLATDTVCDLHFVGAGCGSQCLPLYRYDAEGKRHDNLTDWGLRQFQEHYGDQKITKRDVFHYTYAVLHHPAYRAKYEINLKREFPRLPFYEDFRPWAAWGRTLMELHLGYEQAAPFPLARHDRKEPAGKQADLLPDERLHPARLLDEKPKLKPKLKADKSAALIEIDATTTLHGIPDAAWDYKLGHRSGLEWVLNQWKEHKISDPTVAAKFNTYRFADHKETVIALLARVCTVSVETMKIVRAMP